MKVYPQFLYLRHERLIPESGGPARLLTRSKDVTALIEHLIAFAAHCEAQAYDVTRPDLRRRANLLVTEVERTLSLHDGPP